MSVHPTAIVEEGVEIGEGTSVWDNVHLRGPCTIGRDCIIGEKSYVAYGVSIGDRVKINSFVYICNGVTVEDGVMISAGVIFTNDRYPRAVTPDLLTLRGSDPDEHTLSTRVARGAAIGAGAVIGCGLEIGEFSMIGMGSVVTRDVDPFHLVAGNPARTIALVCRCGTPFFRFKKNVPEQSDIKKATCAECGLEYGVINGIVKELTPPGKVRP
jgi:acetyltransferase-like isoleucine patch superfamily enzyme